MSDHYTGLSITQQEHGRLAAAVSGVGAADGGEEKEEGGSGAAEEKEGREMPDASNPCVGETVQKHFPGHGIFQGTVMHAAKDDQRGWFFHAKYIYRRRHRGTRPRGAANYTGRTA